MLASPCTEGSPFACFGQASRSSHARAQAEEDARKREAILNHLEQQLESGSWRESLKPGARRYLKVDGGNARIDRTRLEDDAKFDGKWVLRTTTTLPPAEVALAYRGLWRVEDAFRTLKTPLELGPSTTRAKRAFGVTCNRACSPTCSPASSTTAWSKPGSTSARKPPSPN